MSSDHPELLVVDASALVNVFVESGRSGVDIARRMHGCRFFAPHLLPFEVANTLRRHRGRGIITEETERLALDELSRLPVELWPFEAVGPRVKELGHNLSSYDASYVALAEHLNCPLITRDARIARAPGVRAKVEVFA